ncbi:MAG: M13 family metallopeptidase [Burkholderiaceae bacterium]
MKILRRAALMVVLPFAAAAGVSFGAEPPSAAAGLDRGGMDAGIRPQDDLFKAMNGGWLKATAIPADKAEYGVLTALEDQSDARVKGIVEKLAGTPQAPGSIEAKIGDFYASYLDTEAIDKAGLAPLRPYLDRIDAVKSRHDLIALMGRWQGVVDQPIDLGVQPDPRNPSIYSAQASQGGLGLPDRDYYLKDGARFAAARAAYLRYVTALLAQGGDRRAAVRAAAAIALEKRIARAQWSQVRNRDPVKTYNPMTLEALEARAPGLDWAAFLEAGGMPAPPFVSISQPSYAFAFARMIASAPLDGWKTYLRVRLLDTLASRLPAGFRDARFAYRGGALQGLKRDLPRWKKAVAALDDALGEAVGQVYVSEYFPPADKARIAALVGNLLKAYATSIDGLAWMTPATKVAAHEKLSKYTVKVGYPDVWRDYGGLEIEPGDAVGNEVRAAKFDYERRAVRVGKPVDRTEWEMTPQTVNAYYEPSKNEIVFPAAILQPPLFDSRADDAINYGAIGMFIGHEISHGFDDSGRQYDGDGRLRDWWTAEDAKAFQRITSRLVAQFSAGEPLAGHHVNGELTLGENIADLSGLQVAFKAYKLSLGGGPSPVIDGFTGEQRFYLGFSQSWREKMRDELAFQLLTRDPHSPAEWRVDGAAINSDGFHDAFATRPGDRMWKAPADRIRLW